MRSDFIGPEISESPDAYSCGNFAPLETNSSGYLSEQRVRAPFP